MLYSFSSGNNDIKLTILGDAVGSVTLIDSPVQIIPTRALKARLWELDFKS